MADFDTTRLRECIDRYRSEIPALGLVADALPGASLDALIALYEQCHPLLEHALWNNEVEFDDLLPHYQALFREQEKLIARRGDQRYRFILSIPVADRPLHLQNCLESIHALCRHFAYGGQTDGVYPALKVIVAEDSREPGNIRRHRELIEAYRRKGLQVVHFDQDEQYRLLHALPDDLRARLGHLLTELPRERFYLKGQAANRNLSYLKCLQLTEDKSRTLYYMVDSDQSFCINRMTPEGERTDYALNYFYAIDRIFRSSDTLMLTGKLVGDPPVSPAVMTANFLDDVMAYFTTLDGFSEDTACRFHGLPDALPGDAAYHDMAGLFGFRGQAATFAYRCRLHGDHDHADCLRDFSRRLNAFFFGEHLTRKTAFSFRNGYRELTPARTVYPGNYVVNYAGLKYIIPFGHLRLRMSGPTAGRLIAAEIGDRFASVNLPHLHRRTSEAGAEQDFRPGVEVSDAREHRTIDLSNEFERQFFGDLMLFTTEALVLRADVARPFPGEIVRDVIDLKEAELLSLYGEKHRAILAQCERLEAWVFDRDRWWHERAELAGALRRVRDFIDNVRFNFGEQSTAWMQIRSADHRTRRKRQIVDALMSYRAERDAWDSLFT